MKVSKIINLINEEINNDRNFVYHRDIIIVGENTAGKSKLLKELLRKQKYKEIYFIDDKNRSIPIKEGLISEKFDRFTSSEIVKYRIKDGIFNKKDAFSKEFDNEVVLGELIANKDKYILLFDEVLEMKMTIEEQDSSNTIKVSDVSEEIEIDSTNLRHISSGVQSKLRILMEVNYASENGCKVIIIDEFNTNLDYVNSSIFFLKLKNKYPHIRFIITTHSIYTVKGIKDADILKIYKQYDNVLDNRCEYFDSDDLDNLEIIDKKLFSGKDSMNKIDERDIELSNYLKVITAGKEIDEEDRKILSNMDNLNLRQKVVHKYIMEELNKK